MVTVPMFYPGVFQLLVRSMKLMVIYLLMTPSLSAQMKQLSFAETKAHYTIEIAKQIKWPNEKEMEQFTVGIVGNDPELFEAFQQRRLTKVRGKTFVIMDASDADFARERYSIIFITQKRRSQNSKIFANVANSLIIVDGKVSKAEQMINLLSSKDLVTINFNRINLIEKGFIISTNLLEFAGSKKDLGEQLKDMEVDLKRLYGEVEEKEQKLVVLNHTISQNSSLIDSAKSRLAESNKVLTKNKLQLTSLLNEIEESQADAKQSEQDIARQKVLMQEEMLAREKAMATLQVNIEDNQRILEQQIMMIEQQNTLIENKDETITEQRSWMMAILIVSFVFFVMIYFLLYTNKLRRKANSELKQLNSQLYELATTDGMTNLYNRRYFLELAQKELLRQQRKQVQSVLLMIDIDHFKSVNDQHGHIAGDEAIKSVANLLTASMRKYDLIGRLGGEEYAMMLIDCDITLATEIAQRLCAQVAANDVVYQDIKIKVTISIGLSQLSAEDTDVDQTLGRADKALYQAKNSGRNRVIVYSE